MPQKVYLDENGDPIVTPPSTRGVVSENEPGTWGGGFLKGLLGDKALMTTAGITAAGLAAPVSGGSSLLTIPALMAAGGAAGAMGANAVRRGYGTGRPASMASEAAEGGVEGALATSARRSARGVVGCWLAVQGSTAGISRRPS